MNHIPVQSNLLASVAFDGAGIMETLYRRGGLYRHEGVPLDIFEQVLNPGSEHEYSVGKAFNSLIKNAYPGVKVEAATIPQRKETADTRQSIEAAGQPAVPETANSKPADIPAEAQAVSRKSNELANQAAAIEVTNPIAQQEASQFLLTVAAMRKQVADLFAPMKDAAHKAHKVICDQEKTVDAPLAAAERLLKDRIGAYVQEQRRLAAVTDEQNRQAELTRAREEQQRRAAEEAINQAVELEARGDMKAAEAVLENPAPVPMRYVAPAPVAPAVSQTKGVATRFEWDFRILDADRIPREYLVVDEAAIRRVVKATSGKIRIPGIENYEKPVVASSRRG